MVPAGMPQRLRCLMADEDNAAYLRKAFKKADCSPAEAIVKVGGEKDYTVHAKRRAAIPNVTVEGANGLGYFQKNKYEYNSETTSDIFSITSDCTNNTDGCNQENMLITCPGRRNQDFRIWFPKWRMH